MPDDDLKLLREYAATNSEAPFAVLVSRHINLVYSVALRQVRDAHDAEEITQAVFIILARKAKSLSSHVVLSGWLCRVARYAGAKALRTRFRRRQREQEACMQSILNCGSDASSQPSDEAWLQIHPLLDRAMEKLGRKDHDALVLRFFENKTFAEVGANLDASEDAAKTRVHRALEKLRAYFSKRGVNSTAETIAGAISANSIQAAPVALAKAVTAIAVAKGATASVSTLTLIKGALKIMAWTKAKTAIIIGAGVLMASATATITVQEIESHGTLTIRMHVDGSDFLRVSGNQLWLEHAFYVMPDNPIYVNGRPWAPTWDGNVSTKYTGLKPAFNPHNPQKIQLAVTAGRGPVSIAHLPAPDNNQTLSVLINDNDYDGQDWYEFTVSW